MSADGLKPEVIDAEFVDVGESRRQDRRAQNRRTVRAKLDTLFAATLVNQIAAQEETCTGAYALTQKLRAGVVVNVEA